VHYFLLALIVAIGALNILVLFGRIIPGPTVFDRLVGVSLIGTNTIILFLLLGAVWERLDMVVNVALAYAVVGFITLLVLAKYFEGKSEEDAES